MPILYSQYENPWSSTVGRCNASHLWALGSPGVTAGSGVMTPAAEGSGSSGPGVTWAYDYCPTPYAWMPMVGLVLYLVAFAPGESLIKSSFFLTEAKCYVSTLLTESS